ncbi:hypothetical protein [Janibacter anophelis]|uniref:hypothetical protein n=1 Tax=Janibacter anophelis TaxID=319054 RepID=UPI003B8A5C37
MISTLLTRRGWTVRYLGGDTPLDAVASAAVRARADLVVLGATRPEALAAAADTAARLVEVTQVAIGGPGASQAMEIVRTTSSLRRVRNGKSHSGVRAPVPIRSAGMRAVR